MWIRVGGVKSGRLINFIVLPLGSAMVIDPMDLMCNHHLTPTRGGMETVNRNLNGAEILVVFFPFLGAQRSSHGKPFWQSGQALGQWRVFLSHAPFYCPAPGKSGDTSPRRRAGWRMIHPRYGRATACP